MFSVTVDDKEYKVEFQHYNPAGPVYQELMAIADEGNHDFKMFGTDCNIYLVDTGHLAEGSTILHPKDFHSYRKNFGRKEAMDRALHNAFPGEDNKETRRKFWQAYYEARGKKW